jgi:hypothetical protein
LCHGGITFTAERKLALPKKKTVEWRKCQCPNAERSSTGIRMTLVENMPSHSRITDMAMSPVASDEEKIILPKSTSHCDITVTTGAKEIPLFRSVKTQVVAVHHV